MKRLFCLFPILLLLLLCGCNRAKTVFQPYVQPQNTIVTIDGTFPEGFSVLDPALFSVPASESTAGDPSLQWAFQKAADGAEQYALVSEAARTPKTSVLVVALMTDSPTEQIIAAARDASLPLLLCGVKPADELLESYDNCWYIGFDPDLAVESQAKLLLQLWADGTLPDVNGDYKYNCITVSAAGSEAFLSDYSAQIIRLLQIGGANFSAVADGVAGSDASDLAGRLSALFLPQVKTIEFDTAEGDSDIVKDYQETLSPAYVTEYFLCSDPASTQAALQTAAQLKAQNSDVYAGILAYGKTEAIQSALQAGELLGTVTPDTAAANTALHALALNLAQRFSPLKDTDYKLTNGKCLMLGYLTFTAGTDTEG